MLVLRLPVAVLAIILTISGSSAKVCESEECKAVAGEISRNLNPKADPCDDFYLYACGRHTSHGNHLMSLSLIQEELNRRQLDLMDNDDLKNHGSKIIKKMKREYDDCLNNLVSSPIVFNVTKTMSYSEGIKSAPKDAKTFIPEGFLGSSDLVDPNPNRARCRNRVASNYRWAFIRIYLDRYFTLADAKATRKMISNVRSTVAKTLIDRVSWLNEGQKKKANEMASTLTLNIGYPDWVADDAELDKEYEGSEHDSWPMDPLTVNAHYSPGNHEITIPAGILLGSVYNRKVPNYLNYGGGGFVAGHEISHGMYVWTDDQAEHSARDDAYQCIIDQMEATTDPTSGRPIPNGIDYLGEMLADVGGVNASLNAYRKLASKFEEQQLPGLTDLSPTQLFFLSEANTWCMNSDLIDKQTKFFKEWPPFSSHPPPYYRVVVPAMNSPDFAQAFQCKEGSRMNPTNKCRMW